MQLLNNFDLFKSEDTKATIKISGKGRKISFWPLLPVWVGGSVVGGPSTLDVPVSYAGFDTTQLNESVTEGFELKVFFH